MTYKKAGQDILDMVREISEKHHHELDGMAFGVLSQEKASKSKGKITLANAQRPSEKMRPLFEEDVDFIICVAQDEWDKASKEKRVALIDHELCHCGLNDDGPYIRPHDMEEFAAVIERHGFWRKDYMDVQIQQAMKIKLGVKVSSMKTKEVK